MKKINDVFYQVAEGLTEKKLPLKLLKFADIDESSDPAQVVADLEKDFQGSGNSQSEKIAKSKNGEPDAGQPGKKV